jgi:hypothetical protein
MVLYLKGDGTFTKEKALKSKIQGLNVGSDEDGVLAFEAKYR